MISKNDIKVFFLFVDGAGDTLQAPIAKINPISII
jgi:hypothetical protein